MFSISANLTVKIYSLLKRAKLALDCALSASSTRLLLAFVGGLFTSVLANFVTDLVRSMLNSGPSLGPKPIVVELIQNVNRPEELRNEVAPDFGWGFAEPNVNVRAIAIREDSSESNKWKLDTLLIYRRVSGETVHLLGKINGGPPSGSEDLRDESLDCSYRVTWSLGDRAVPVKLKDELVRGEPTWLNYYLILDIQPLEEKAVCQL